jgi:large subunit ribosomal protein L32
MVVRMRATRSHRNNRRSHFALTEPRVSVCEKCGKFRLSHTACSSCGTYRGRTLIDLQARVERKLRKQKEKEKAGAK